jgi:hypothetical protein
MCTSIAMLDVVTCRGQFLENQDQNTCFIFPTLLCFLEVNNKNGGSLCKKSYITVCDWASSTTKNGLHDISEILLKVVLTNQIKSIISGS